MDFKTGNVLIRTNTRLPENLGVGGKPISTGWMLLNEDIHSFEQSVQFADWHFFRISDEVKSTVIARKTENAVARALRMALRRLTRRYNTAEILRIGCRSVAGFAVCKVHLAARHVQSGPILGLTHSVGLLSPRLTLAKDFLFRENEPQTAAT